MVDQNFHIVDIILMYLEDEIDSMMIEPESLCSNCHQPVSGNYCSACGQPVHLHRIDQHYVGHEFLHLFHFEKGIFYTAKELITRPGENIREYIQVNRSKHMKPVAYLILTSLLFTLVAHFFHADDIYNGKEQLLFGNSSIGNIMQWVQTHYGYSNIIMGGFIALCVRVFFSRHKFNIYEITVLMCFVMGQSMLLLTLETFFIHVISEPAYKAILALIALAYPTWAIGQFFDKRKLLSYVKAFLAYFAGYLLFYVAVIVVGLTTDVILKAFVHH